MPSRVRSRSDTTGMLQQAEPSKDVADAFAQGIRPGDRRAAAGVCGSHAAQAEGMQSAPASSQCNGTIAPVPIALVL